ncbi:MAG TPA: biotin/lipoyl-containing protein [Thermoanaerobaculia bacterium]|nr:biotin/lipoyl-containing protein [Thermoanaerobaculia bacterium]
MSGLRLRAGTRAEEVRLLGEGEASIGDRRVSYRRTDAAGGAARIEIDGRAHRLVVARDGAKVWVWCDGEARVFERGGGARSSSAGDDAPGLAAPMPGRVRRILAREGERVERGAVLLVLEAMKMEHAIRAPRAGVVARLRVAEGDLVDAGAELVDLE